MVVLLLAAAVTGCGGVSPGAPDEAPPPAAPPPDPARPAVPALAVGITEPNPVFLRPTGEPVPEPFGRWRDALDRWRPSHYRLVVDWPAIQPDADRPPDLELVRDGCGRSGPPCAAWTGIREQLRTLAERQRNDRGAWQVLTVLDGTPAWAGRAVGGCLQGSGGARARPLSERGRAELARLVEAILAAGREEGVDLRWWSARNEPNHPHFLAPQRSRCSAGAPSVAVESYVEATQSVRTALDSTAGRHELVLGELAGIDERRPRSTSVGEFIRALPRELVCDTRVWSQHAYIGGKADVAVAAAELRRFACAAPHEIWVTETGVGGALVGRSRPHGPKAAGRDCRALHRQLRRWYADRSVTVAFQYTLREDDLFPTGLVDASLVQSYLAFGEWQAWGTRARPSATDEPPETACRRPSPGTEPTAP